jgi:hypothetical protein
MRKWITAVDEQNVRFAEIQSLLHKQEIALTGPATTEMVIALLAVLLVFGFVAWMIRDSNAEAARTLQSAIAVLPTLKDVIRNREITAKEASVKSSMLTEESHRRVVASVERSTGTILEYLDDPSYGYIAPADGGDKVSFNKNELSDTMSSLLRTSTARIRKDETVQRTCRFPSEVLVDASGTFLGQMRLSDQLLRPSILPKLLPDRR